jgi:hypothetical protein
MMKDLGNLSAVDPVYQRRMWCIPCQVTWQGCWDAFECPMCGEGELPSPDIDSLIRAIGDNQ